MNYDSEATLKRFFYYREKALLILKAENPAYEDLIFTESEDYWNLPDGQRAELIDGKLYAMAPPNRIHLRLVHQLDKLIGNYIDSNKGTCEVYPAPFAVNLTANDKVWVAPDISVICDKDKLSDRGCEGAPDRIIEIVSPGSSRMDYSVKLFKYRGAGVLDRKSFEKSSTDIFL